MQLIDQAIRLAVLNTDRYGSPTGVRALHTLVDQHGLPAGAVRVTMVCSSELWVLCNKRKCFCRSCFQANIYNQDRGVLQSVSAGRNFDQYLQNYDKLGMTWSPMLHQLAHNYSAADK